MHCASFIQVGVSVVKPGKYYENNGIKTLVSLAVMVRHDVKSFFSSLTIPPPTVPVSGNVCDLASEHLLALEHLRVGGSALRLSLGSEPGCSVKRVLPSVREVVGKAVPQDVMERRAGDPAMLVSISALDVSTLGWRPQYPEL